MAYKDGTPLGKAINGVMLERVWSRLLVWPILVIVIVQPWFVPKLDAEGSRMLTLTACMAMYGCRWNGLRRRSF